MEKGKFKKIRVRSEEGEELKKFLGSMNLILRDLKILWVNVKERKVMSVLALKLNVGGHLKCFHLKGDQMLNR